MTATVTTTLPNTSELSASAKSTPSPKSTEVPRINVTGTPKKNKTPPASSSSVPPRKRSKVSRACDECRRKKIRCDAGMEEDPQCSSCKKAGEKCSFSRIPMKRGPSKRQRWEKKEKNGGASPKSEDDRSSAEFVLSSVPPPLPLAQQQPVQYSSSSQQNFGGHQQQQQRYDRLPSIETLTQVTPAPTPVPDANVSPKSGAPQWPFTNGLHQAPPPPPQQQPQHRYSVPSTTAHYSPPPSHHVYPPPPHHHPAAARSEHYSAAAHAARHNSIDSTLATPPATTTPPALYDSNSSSSSSNAFNEPYKRSFSTSKLDEPGWDDRCIDNYYQVVHPALPILPSSRVRLRARLLACSNSVLRRTMLCGVCGLVSQKDSVTSRNEYKSHVLQGILQISGSEHVNTLNTQSKILYLISLILLFLQSGESLWLGSAINLAYDMNLHKTRTKQASADVEDDANLSRRLFLILVILDRLNAAVKQVPIQIPDHVVHLNQETDAMCFGSRVGPEVVRLCMILGHGSSTANTNTSAKKLFSELESAYSTIETMWDTTPILKALYYLVLVHFDKFSIVRSPQDKTQALANLLNDSSALAMLLESPLICVSPLIGYFIPPLVNILIDVVQYLPESSSSNKDAELMRHQFWKQLDFLDSLIDRKFKEFAPLRHDISETRSSFSSSPRSRLEGLAAVAHVAHQQAVRTD
ncbi:hypothetical protein TRVA0_036S00254 [Trichomonascus vanleenenianus]|uniref:uncharacterized protein n=1 Tax=Trichomonascus vanleenenianus TaxID=2268995 RepID=UPI003ECB9C42